MSNMNNSEENTFQTMVIEEQIYYQLNVILSELQQVQSVNSVQSDEQQMQNDDDEESYMIYRVKTPKGEYMGFVVDNKKTLSSR